MAPPIRKSDNAAARPPRPGPSGCAKNGVCGVAKLAQVSNLGGALRLASIRFLAATLSAH
jgi:hypothetical protein